MSKLTRAAMIALVGIALTAGGLSACGGDGETAEETTESITRSDWVVQVNEICRETAAINRDQLNEVLRQRPVDPAALRNLFAQLSPAVRGSLDEIKALAPPDGLEEEIEAMVANGTAEADRLDAAVGDSAVMKEALSEGVFPDLYKSLLDLGLKDCASVTGPENFAVSGS